MLDENKKRHIVIVDDDPVNLELAEHVLKNRYKLTKLISGAQLLTFLNRVKPDMILLDIQMPEMNGFAVMEKISANPERKNIPVIFLTGQDNVESEKKCFLMGAKDFIKKPFDNDIMLARINSQIELHIYREGLEELVEQKTKQISDLHHMLTVSCAEIIESRDGTTGCHVRNTTAYYEILIRALSKRPEYKLKEDIIEELLKASALHDLGKVGISDAILKKPGPLTELEFEDMKKHSQIGAEMIEKLVEQTSFDNFLGYAKDMAWFHHEKWDGTGYPCGMSGQLIPVYVRALSIVDVYDALTSVRPYKRAFTHEEAMEIITADKGKFYDPEIYDVFMENEQNFRDLEKSRL